MTFNPPLKSLVLNVAILSSPGLLNFKNAGHYNEELCGNKTMPPAWQAELADSFTRPEDLLDFLGIASTAFKPAPHLAGAFPFRVTRSFAARMRPGDPRDPLLRQVLPLQEEFVRHADFLSDPVGDLQSVVHPGLLHKYQGRVLLIMTGACAIHCRYCFRREFPYADNTASRFQETKSVDYIAANPDVTEVILSGGDPLIPTDERLQALIERLERIPHLQRLRIHSRLPVVLPSRVTEDLASLLSGRRLRTVMVIHCNHPAELDDTVASALARLKSCGITLLNQAVLLRGVNDDPSTLTDLNEALLKHGVLPYYLHMLDRARGTAHFEVAEDKALGIMESLRIRLPGYLVPRLVREVSGHPYKMPMT